MSKRQVAVTRACEDALTILGGQIKRNRLAKGWTQSDLAARLGVNPRTISALEGGSPTVAIGTVFNAAVTVGLNLFGLEGNDLALARHRAQETLALLPSQVRPARRVSARTEAADDDF